MTIRGGPMGILVTLFFVLLALAGCGTTSSDSSNIKSAKVHTELAGLYFERG